MVGLDSMLSIPDRSFAAYIFDCDGTLVDSMPLHYLAWMESLKLHKAPFEFTEDVFYGYAGVREQDVVRILNQRYGTSIDPDSVAERKMEIFHRSIPAVRPVQPVASLAKSRFGTLPMAVASGSEEPTVRACLDATGLLHLFDTIVTPRDVPRGKPAPDMFLLAARRMGVEPGDCLVFEDGNSGLEAAKAAGMEAVFVPRSVR